MSSSEKVASKNDKENKLFVENSPHYNRMAVVCHVTIFLYAAAFWIHLGVFPFLTKKLGVDTVIFGYLQTAMALSMLIGGPLFGHIGDRYGTKTVFLASFAGSFIFYFLMAIADNVIYLFISRLFGFLMNAMQCAQMVMTDVSGTRDRATALGHLSVAYGLGMIVGPTLGGWLTRFYNEHFADGVSAGLMIIAFLIILVTMPQHTKDVRKVVATKKGSSSKVEDNSIFNVKGILALLSIPEVFYLITVKTLIGIPAGVFHSMFSVVNMERYNLTPEMNGYLLTFVGILTAVMQSVGIKFFTRRFSDLIIIRVSLVAMAISYFLLVGVTSIWILGLTLIPIVISGSLMNTVASSILTKKVPEKNTGATLGLNMATHSLIRTFSPTVGAYLYIWFGHTSFGFFGFIVNGLVALVVNIYPPPGL